MPAAAFFCILGVLLLFAQLTQRDGPAEQPEASPAWRWGDRLLRASPGAMASFLGSKSSERMCAYPLDSFIS